MTKNNYLTALIVLWLIVCIGGSSLAFASKFSEYDIVHLEDVYSDSAGEFQTVGLTIGGEDVITDVPAIIYTTQQDGVEKSRTLVPIRVISEMLGADVEWFEEERAVLVSYSTSQMKLYIDQSEALVDGETVRLTDGIPPKVFNYNGDNRTLVPLRFVAEHFGLSVDWENETRTARLNRRLQRVEAIKYDYNEGAQQISIRSTGLVEHTDYFIDGTELDTDSKLVVQFANVVLAEDLIETDKEGNHYLEIDEGGIKTLAAIQEVERALPEVHFEISMKKNRGYEIVDKEGEVIIKFINNVHSISSQRQFGKRVVEIKTAEKPHYTTSSWNGNFIIDIFDAKIEFDKAGQQWIDVQEDGIDYISFSQLDAMAVYQRDDWVTRVVVNLEDEGDFKDMIVQEKENGLLVFLDNESKDNLVYEQDGSTGSILQLVGESGAVYRVAHDEAVNTLTIRVLQGKIDLLETSFQPDDDIVKQVDVVRSDQHYLIVLQLEKQVTFETEKLDDNLQITLRARQVADALTRQKIIVLDGGHGGKDPGAISPIDGTKEKDIVLRAVYKVNQKLLSKGFKVYMTRDRDSYVDLYSRTEIANKLQADVFISLHANAAGSGVSGIETLYGNSPIFATTMHNAVIAKTAANDRGLHKRLDLVVIRESEMPAIIIEMGFLTNLGDLQLLKDDVYIDLIAEGIVEGVSEYYNLLE